jgi:hypothetical protein
MRSVIKKYITLIVVALACASTSSAQDVALKTNLLGWAAGGTINGGLEVGLGRKTTMQLYGALNPWTYSDGRRARFWYASPEIRFWFCQKFSGSFLGIHALGGEYNIRNIDLPFNTLPDLPDGYHYDGWYVGGGLTYGYQWVMSKHWNFEASLGVGYAYTRYRMCQNCKPRDTKPRNYVGPTKAALSLIYCF